MTNNLAQQSQTSACTDISLTEVCSCSMSTYATWWAFPKLQEQFSSNARFKLNIPSSAGLMVLADLKVASQRTVLKGNASHADALILCPGFHRQQDTASCNGGEYPVTANILSGYVFRVENEATVHYLQRVGRTGNLTTVHVEEQKAFLTQESLASRLGSLLYLLCIIVTASTLTYDYENDIWAFVILLILIVARCLNVVSVRNRCDSTWHGVKEPGVHGDLLILLSRDRWIRMKGLTDDLKAVTSGQWLRDPRLLENIFEGCSVVLVYLCAMLSSNASQEGNLLLLAMLLVNSSLLALSNELQDSLRMKKRVLRVVGPSQPYKRRLDLANQLVKESGRKDWALKLGMVNASTSKETKATVPQVEV